MELIAVLGFILAVLAIFFVDPKEAWGNLKAWFAPVIKILQYRHLVDSRSAQDFFERLKIEGIKVENLFIANPLTVKRLKSKFVDKQLDYPEKIKKIFIQQIEDKKVIAARDGKTLDNNASYSLHRIDVSRPEGVRGARENIYTLICYPTDYEHFIFPNLVLDEQVLCELSQEKNSIRNITGLRKEALFIANIGNLEPYHFRIGTGSVLLTNDGYVIASVRSRKQFVAGDVGDNNIQVHLSTAEGMFRSTKENIESDLIDGEPNPFATSIRSFDKELNLKAQHGITPEGLRCLGYFMDKTRAEVFFLFLLKSTTLSLSDVFSLLGDPSTDIQENDWVIGLKWNPTNVLKLFNNDLVTSFDYAVPSRVKEEFEYSTAGKRIRLASNHAQAGFAVAALYDFGGNSCFHALKEAGI